MLAHKKTRGVTKTPQTGTTCLLLLLLLLPGYVKHVARPTTDIPKIYCRRQRQQQ